jgi:hypothetical protein
MTRIGVAYGPEHGNSIVGYRRSVYGVLEVVGGELYAVREGFQERDGSGGHWVTVGLPLGGPGWRPEVPFWSRVTGFHGVCLFGEHRKDGIPLYDVRREVPDAVDVTYRLTLKGGAVVDYRVSVHSDRPVNHWDGERWHEVMFVNTVED